MSLEGLIQTYRDRAAGAAPTSASNHQRASRSLVGGVTGESKAWFPLQFVRGQGGRIVDADGNEFVDLIMGFGPSILGHGAPRVAAAIESALRAGFPLGVATPLEIELAEQIQKLVPTMELMRFVTTGTEATMMALRVARAYTGRHAIAKFEGHFHGQHDAALVSTLAEELPGTESDAQPVVDCAGLSPALVRETVVLPWGDRDAALRTIRRHQNELAAVILEPVPAPLGAESPEPEFLRALRDVTNELGILLVFDEVITGFRLSPGGAAAFFGVRPDLHVFGKVAGGGLPLGVYGGRADIMSAVFDGGRPLRHRMYQSGTFSGLPLAMAAGIATLTAIQEAPVLATATARATQIRDGWRSICRDQGVRARVTGTESLFGIYFADRPIRTRRDVLASDKRASLAFSLGLLAERVYLPPLHIGLTSAAHTEEDVAAVLAASDRVLRELAAVIGSLPRRSALSSGPMSDRAAPSASQETKVEGSIGHSVAAETIALTNVRIVDGNGGAPIEHGTILISGTRIVAVGDAARVDIVPGSHRIDGRGTTAIPGLVDMHVHVPGAFLYRAFLDAQLYAGVTTMLDVGNSVPFIYELRSRIAQGSVFGPRLYAVGEIIDGPDAIGFHYLTIVSKDQVPRFVKRRVDEQADLMKLYNSLSDRMVNAIAIEGKRYGLRSIIDQWDRDGSVDITRTGIAGYAHMPIRGLTDDEVAALKKYGVFFLSTLAIIDKQVGRRWIEGPAVLDEPLIVDIVSKAERDLWRETWGKLTPQQFKELAFDPVDDFPGVLQNVRKLLDAGVLIVIGTDAPFNGGVFPGECVHREMELMVEGGATPLEAITAATKNGAVIMNATEEWGTLAPGRAADVLLVDGKPDQHISDTRKIHLIMMDGTVVDRAKLRIDPASSEVRWYRPPEKTRPSNENHWWHYPDPERASS